MNTHAVNPNSKRQIKNTPPGFRKNEVAGLAEGFAGIFVRQMAENLLGDLILISLP
jgi:hypothetical protein